MTDGAVEVIHSEFHKDIACQIGRDRQLTEDRVVPADIQEFHGPVSRVRLHRIAFDTGVKGRAKGIRGLHTK